MLVESTNFVLDSAKALEISTHFKHDEQICRKIMKIEKLPRGNEVVTLNFSHYWTEVKLLWNETFISWVGPETSLVFFL